MSAGYALVPAGVGLAIAQAYAWGTRVDAENPEFGPQRLVIAGVTTPPLIFALVAAVLAWSDGALTALAGPLAVVGVTALATNIVQSQFIRHGLPVLGHDPGAFGPLLVRVAAAEAVVILGLVYFNLAFMGVL